MLCNLLFVSTSGLFLMLPPTSRLLVCTSTAYTQMLELTGTSFVYSLFVFLSLQSLSSFLPTAPPPQFPLFSLLLGHLICLTSSWAVQFVAFKALYQCEAENSLWLEFPKICSFPFPPPPPPSPPFSFLSFLSFHPSLQNAPIPAFRPYEPSLSAGEPHLCAPGEDDRHAGEDHRPSARHHKRHTVCPLCHLTLRLPLQGGKDVPC